MLPITTDIKLQRIPVVTIFLCTICCMTFFIVAPRSAYDGVVPLDFIHTILHPDNRLISSGILVMTSFFLHGGLPHLLGNMWYLWLFGSRLEEIIGHRQFLTLYLVSGIIALLSQIAKDPLSPIPIIGASGAIAGVMGMYFLVLPFSKISIGIPVLFSFRVYAGVFLLLWFWLQWKNVAAPHPSTNAVAWWAHIGGFCFGILFGWSYRLFPPNRLLQKKKK